MYCLTIFKDERGFFDSEKILQACAEKTISGFVAAHSIPNIFFILRKFYSEEERREILSNIISLLSVVELNYNLISNAILRGDFHDFEDCLQDECAVLVSADYILTRNGKDFERSKIKAMTPADFVKNILR